VTRAEALRVRLKIEAAIYVLKDAAVCQMDALNNDYHEDENAREVVAGALSAAASALEEIITAEEVA